MIDIEVKHRLDSKQKFGSHTHEPGGEFKVRSAWNIGDTPTLWTVHIGTGCQKDTKAYFLLPLSVYSTYDQQIVSAVEEDDDSADTNIDNKSFHPHEVPVSSPVSSPVFSPISSPVFSPISSPVFSPFFSQNGGVISSFGFNDQSREVVSKGSFKEEKGTNNTSSSSFAWPW